MPAAQTDAAAGGYAPSMSSFKAFPQLAAWRDDPALHSRRRPGPWVLEWFAADTRPNQLARALLEARVLPFKEVIESFEFFERARRRVRAPVVADLCCGHGLVGLLYGVFHRDVEQVLLVDRTRPASAEACVAALQPLAPWLPSKVRYEVCRLEDLAVPASAAVLGVHACGVATDAVIDHALRAAGPVALLPCCHPKSGMPGPASLGRALGVEMATDIHRTYRLEAAGYTTRWAEIPAAVTPMNRVILAWPARG